MNLRALILALLLVGGFSASAKATTPAEFDFSFSESENIAPGVLGYTPVFYGVLYTTPIVGGNYQINAISGTYANWGSAVNFVPQYEPITGLDPSVGTPDNIVYTTYGPIHLDNYGFSFDAGSYGWNLVDGVYAGAYTVYGYSSGAYLGGNNGFCTITQVSSVPEPSQYGVFVFLAVAGFLAWRRFSGESPSQARQGKKK